MAFRLSKKFSAAAMCSDVKYDAGRQETELRTGFSRAVLSCVPCLPALYVGKAV